MGALDIRPVKEARGDIREAIRIIRERVPEDTVVVCPYVASIFTYGGKNDG